MSLTTLNNLAYDTWEPDLNNQLENDEGSLYAWLPKTAAGVRGRNVFVKHQVGRPTGVANIDEGASFPTAGDASWSESKIVLSRIAGTVEFTLDEMELLDGRDAAALPVVQYKLEDLTNTLRRDIIRQSWYDGSAKLARCNVTAASATVNLQTTSTNQYDRDRGNWLGPLEMLVDIVKSDGTKDGGETGLSIVSAASDFSTITLSAAVTTANTDVITRAGNVTSVTATYTSREFPGILAGINDANTYLNINRGTAANAYWKSNVVFGSSPGTPEPITLDRVLKLMNTMRKRAGMGPKPNTHAFFSNLGVWSAYGEMMQPGVRYTKDQSLDFGWPTLEIFGIPFYADIHAPKNNLFLIEKNAFQYRRPKYERRPLFQFQNEDGTIFRYVADSSADGYKAKVQAHLTGMMTLVTERPNHHGRLDDITEVGV